MNYSKEIIIRMIKLLDIGYITTIYAIPFPLNGIYGFNHLKVKELSTATIFSIVFIYFYQYYQSKVKYILSKIII